MPPADPPALLVPPGTPRVLDQVRRACRLRPLSPRTMDAYVHRIHRYILFHGERYPANLGAAAIAAFLTSLATDRHVSASTQSQALGAGG